MLKVIDLDATPKDCDGIVFTLTLNGEKAGFSEQELVELLRARHGGGKTGARKGSVRGKAVTNSVEAEENGEGGSDFDTPQGANAGLNGSGDSQGNGALTLS